MAHRRATVASGAGAYCVSLTVSLRKSRVRRILPYFRIKLLGVHCGLHERPAE